MTVGKEIKDKLGAACSMCEENKKYTEEISCETSSIVATLLYGR
jgi:hypothetical protein